MTLFGALLLAFIGNSLRAATCLSSLMSSTDLPYREVSLDIQKANLPEHVQRMGGWVEKGIISVKPVGDAPVRDTSGGWVYQRSRYDLLRIDVAGLSLSPDSLFFEHKDMVKRLRTVHSLKHRLILNPALNLTAYYETRGQIQLGVTATYQTFEHEFAHLVYELNERNKLPPDLEQEFQKEILFIAQVKGATRFSEITLHEIFAAVWEYRIARGADEPVLPESSNEYLRAYLCADLKEIGSAHWTAAECEWAKLAGMGDQVLYPVEPIVEGGGISRRAFVIGSLVYGASGVAALTWGISEHNKRMRGLERSMTPIVQTALSELGIKSDQWGDRTVRWRKGGEDWYDWKGQLNLPEGPALIRASFKLVEVTDGRIVTLEDTGSKVLEVSVPGKLKVDVHRSGAQSIYYTLPTQCVGRCVDGMREFSLPDQWVIP
jgi:hypothetical protein